VIVMMRFLSCTQDFAVLTPSLLLPLFALGLPCRLTAAADFPLGMVNIALLLLPQVPCVSSASNLVSDDEVHVSCLCAYFSAPRPLSDHASATTLADSAGKIPIPWLTPRSALVSCDSYGKALIPRLALSCVPFTVRPLFALLLPCRLQAVADALLGMAHIDLLFRLLLLFAIKVVLVASLTAYAE
jgi:hypothetical protein